MSSFSVKAKVDSAMVPCGPAGPQDWGCWELLELPGLAGREQVSLRGTGAAPALDIRHLPGDRAGQDQARTWACG